MNKKELKEVKKFIRHNIPFATRDAFHAMLLLMTTHKKTKWIR